MHDSDDFVENICILLTVFLIYPLILMWGWSLCMPSIFGLKYLTWVEAFGLTLVGGMIFRPRNWKK